MVHKIVTTFYDRFVSQNNHFPKVNVMEMYCNEIKDERGYRLEIDDFVSLRL